MGLQPAILEHGPAPKENSHGELAQHGTANSLPKVQSSSLAAFMLIWRNMYRSASRCTLDVFLTPRVLPCRLTCIFTPSFSPGCVCRAQIRILTFLFAGALAGTHGQSVKHWMAEVNAESYVPENTIGQRAPSRISLSKQESSAQ